MKHQTMDAAQVRGSGEKRIQPDHPSSTGPDENASATCRLCGNGRSLEDLGRLPDTVYFAGHRQDSILPGGHLLRCPECESMQRHPVFDQQTYSELYAKGEGDIWVGQPGRLDAALTRKLVHENPGIRSVLDVGCSGGDLLVTLPEGIQTWGIEPSIKAAETARKRGVKEVRPDIGDLPAESRFDCVVAIDVIEHVAQPGAFLAALAQRVAEEGLLVISTGNPQAPIWHRTLRNSFWYSSFPEHISFPSGRFLSDWAIRNGFEVQRIESFRYFQNATVSRRLAQAMLQFSFLVSTQVHRMLFKLIFGVLLKRNIDTSREYFLPCAGLFEDHQFCVLKRIKLHSQPSGLPVRS